MKSETTPPAKPANGLFPGAFLVLAVLACHGAALAATFGFCDDFPQLLESISLEKWLVRAMAAAGRPAGAILAEYSFRAAGTIENLAWLRALSILLVALFGWVFISHQIRFGADSTAAAMASAFVCGVAPFGVYAGWATLWLQQIPVVLSYFAYRLAGGLTFRGDRLRPCLAAGAAAAILYVSFNIYQPTTAFYFFWIATELALARESTLRVWRLLVSRLIVFGSAAILYYAIYRLAGLHHPRGELTTEPLARLGWFWTTVAPAAGRLHWFDMESLALPVLVFGLAALAFLLQPALAAGERLLRLLLFLLLLVISYLPILVVKEYDATLRSQLPLAAILAAAAWLGASRLIRALGWAAAGRGLLAAILLAALVQANRNMAGHIVFPQAFEYTYLRGQLHSLDPGTKAVFLLAPDTGLWLAAKGRWDEYRLITSVMPHEYHMLNAMAALILREKPALGGVRVEQIPPGAPLPAPGAGQVIDLAPLGTYLGRR